MSVPKLELKPLPVIHPLAKIKTGDDLTAAYHEIPCLECGALEGKRCWSPNRRRLRSVPHNERVEHGSRRHEQQELGRFASR